MRRLAVLLGLAYLVVLGIGWWAVARAGDDGIVDARHAKADFDLNIAEVPVPGAEQLLILAVESGGPADAAGLRSGDAILALDGVPVADTTGFRVASLKRLAGQASTLRVQPADGGPPRDVRVVNRSLLLRPGLALELLVFNVAALLGMIVLVLVAARPDDPAARVLLLGYTAFGALMLFPPWMYVLPEHWLTLQRALLLCGVIGSAAQLHFFLIFPAPTAAFRRLAAVGGPLLRPIGGGIILLYVVPLAVAVQITSGPLQTWTTVYLLASALVALGLLPLLASYRHPPTPLARAQIKWILGAVIVGVVALILGPVLPVLTGGQFAGLSTTVTVAALSLFPIALAVAVLRYRLFDVNAVLRAALVYPLLMAALVAGFLVISLAARRLVLVLWGPVAADGLLDETLAALAVAILAYPARGAIQAALDRLLYRDRLARERLLAEAGEVLDRALPPAAVAAFLTDVVPARIELAGAWLVLPPDANSRPQPPPAPEPPAPEQPLLDELCNVDEPVMLAAGGDLSASAVPTLPAAGTLAPWYDAGARVLVPLRAGGGSRAAAPEARATADDGATGRLAGVWALGPRRSGELLDRDDLRTLGRVGQQAAVLLDYARLSDDEVRQAVVRQELARAREIQTRLLPETLPGWPGRLELAARFRAAFETSGDFYDVYPLDESGDVEGAPAPLQIAVGDVAGKSISAALVMALARTTLRAVTRRAAAVPVATDARVVAGGGAPPWISATVPSPAATMRAAGALLHSDVGRRDFVACALAVVEPCGPGGVSTRLRLTNAAQVPPLLYRGDQVEELAPPGDCLPLGIMPEPQYEELVLLLEPGDVVVFTSDGLPEAPATREGLTVPRPAGHAAAGAASRSAGELFGFERLAASVAYWAGQAGGADAVAAGIWADLAAWCGEGSHHDDMTLVVLRVPAAAD